MGQSILVFISHSSDDKEALIEPIVSDLEDCYIRVWLDKRRIVPGENLRKSIFRDGLDKADVVLIFFTRNSLKSSWVDREIKHVLRDENQKGNDFDLKKIISIFDSQATYDQVNERYPELTDNLLHLMPENYDKIQIGQLISAIWSKYLTLQGGDIETQRQILSKDKEIFQRDKEIQQLKTQINELQSKSTMKRQEDEFKIFVESGKVAYMIKNKDEYLKRGLIYADEVGNVAEARAFGLVETSPNSHHHVVITEKGKDFFKWCILNKII